MRANARAQNTLSAMFSAHDLCVYYVYHVYYVCIMYTVSENVASVCQQNNKQYYRTLIPSLSHPTKCTDNCVQSIRPTKKMYIALVTSVRKRTIKVARNFSWPTTPRRSSREPTATQKKTREHGGEFSSAKKSACHLRHERGERESARRRSARTHALRDEDGALTHGALSRSLTQAGGRKRRRNRWCRKKTRLTLFFAGRRLS